MRLITFILTLFIAVSAQASSTYVAKVVDIYDADTFTLDIDLGFGVRIERKARLYGIDTYELRTKDKCEKRWGYEGKDWVVNFMLGDYVKIISNGKGKFGRELVDVKHKGLDLRDKLVEMKYGREYYGDKKKPWIFGDNCERLN